MEFMDFLRLTVQKRGIKIATEQYNESTTPETVDREVTEAEKVEMHKNFVAPFIPALSQKCLDAVTCLYTTRNEARFLIDRHPDHKNIMVVSPCSGHGFKHSAALGEAIAQNMISEKSELDLTKFSVEHF